MSDPGEEFLRKALTESVTDLAGARRLSVADVGVDGITVFELHRDELGTTRGRGRRALRWATDEALSADSVQRAARGAPDSTVALVCSHSASHTERAMEWLRTAHPAAQAFTCTDLEVDVLLREIVEQEPLHQAYDLVVLKQNTGTGRLELGCEPLFSIGARRGETAVLTVRCAPSDDRGTAFAVVTWGGRGPRPLSIDVAKLVPGGYEITAELERPGRVRLTGLPGLARDTRDWADIAALVPPELSPPAGPAHLICAAETNGTETVVGERLGRIRQVIDAVSAESPEHLQVSLLAYGAHSYDWSVPDEPVQVVCWADSPASALKSLTRLEGRPVTDEGYRHAAQLEDMLAEVVQRLDRARGTGDTALLVLGDRPAHPPRAHPSEILPCPHRHDWESSLRRLRARGVRLGAVCGRPAHRSWHHLGDGAPADLDAVDVRRLTADLGLTMPPSGRAPFPLSVAQR
ncbi:hypothetical protein [Actinomadura sp. DC4]|uniref:hypothetical protein n=1 Tax=Actinomadura sp. DC4 TaxID=3055069 RepID=UPI0025B0F45F|nr:hypothetical protein [Actinomadura sp. DC4]MDN3351449.1 hypothetical protein [Actinomadura sp. DC4]